jgi:predicted 2-oxoglutarate/Fe(II)-dependent dioxygenase YbiX
MITKIQNPIPEHIRLAALATFPAIDWPWWHRYGNGKLATVDPSRIPEGCRAALHALALAVAPPSGFYDFTFYGAGLHYMPAGSALGRHVDASHHPQRPWRRVSSVVCFLDDCDGGELVVEGDTINPIAGLAASFPSNQSHEVLPVKTDRRTISLFAWEIDHGEKQNTSAVFETT